MLEDAAEERAAERPVGAAINHDPFNSFERLEIRDRLFDLLPAEPPTHVTRHHSAARPSLMTLACVCARGQAARCASKAREAEVQGA